MAHTDTTNSGDDKPPKTQVEVLQEFLQPLHDYFAIDVLNLTLLFPDGKYAVVSSDEAYLSFLEAMDVLDDLPMLIIANYQEPGFHFESVEQGNIKTLLNMEQYEFGCSLKYMFPVKHKRSYLLQIELASRQQFSIDQLLNHLDLLQQCIECLFEQLQLSLEQMPLRTSPCANDRAYYALFQQVFMRHQQQHNSTEQQFAEWLAVQKGLVSGMSDMSFTERETQILELTITKNMTYMEISEQLGVSKRTIDRHFENMRKKLQASNKLELVNKAIALNLVKI